MAAKDIFHDTVKKALQKEGWTITHDPLHLEVGGVEMYIDLGAEKLIAAEKNGQKIAVEIQSFAQLSAISEFHTAVGQYRNYQLALQEEHADWTLYLAVPEDSFNKFFTLQFVQNALRYNQIQLIIYRRSSSDG